MEPFVDVSFGRVIYTATIFSVMTIFFFLYAWNWRKKFQAATGRIRYAILFSMLSYSFLFLALWFLCGVVSVDMRMARPIVPPLACIGFIFAYLSYRYS